MDRWERSLREDRYKQERRNPSFSSSLLDEIYRSIDDGDQKHDDLRFYREAMPKKQSRSSAKSSRLVKEEGEGGEEMSSYRRACLIQKWMDKKATEKATAEQKRHLLTDFERKSHHDHLIHGHDQDALFFSSTSSSSDSSSGGFSSSDTESLYGVRSRASCFAPSRPKPVRTSLLSGRSEKTGKTETSLFYQQREFHLVDDHHYGSATDHTPKHGDGLVKSKSRAMKIYGNLKKVKQPISPGGRLASFINSLFTAGNSKKSSKNASSVVSCGDGTIDRQAKSGQVSTCSSASSFSRSCLSKHSPSTRERLRNGVKRSVRFYPVSVIVDEDCRPCGHKSLYGKEDELGLMSVSVPTAWKIGKSPSRKQEEELRFQVMEKSRRVEEMAREFLRDYHQNKTKNDLISTRTVRDKYNNDEDDDAASCSSSDLFELDHLAVIGNDRYREELPVYETTNVNTNLAIANGFIM